MTPPGIRVMRRKAERFVPGTLRESATPDPRVRVVHGELRGSRLDVVQSIVVLVDSVPQAKGIAEAFWEFTPMGAETSIFESVRLDKSQVDAAAGVIKNVKVVGFKSANNGGRREYSVNCLRGAVPLYEGAQVNIDHDRKGTERRVADRFGKLESLRFVEGDGLRGDLRYNVKHPLAEQVAWFAEHMPDALGFSHHTRGACRIQNGAEIVEEIKAVRCVDIVADPATTKSLFESDGGLTESVQAVIADASLDTAAKVRRITELLEGSDSNTPPTRKNHMDAKDITLDMLESRPDLLSALAAKNADAQKVKELTESNTALAAEVKQLKDKQAAADKTARINALLTEAKLPTEAVTPVFRKQLEGAADEAAVKALIEDRKAIAGSVVRPRSADQIKVDGQDRSKTKTDGAAPSMKEFVEGFKSAR